jgi:type 1 glutamine amidotransferase
MTQRLLGVVLASCCLLSAWAKEGENRLPAPRSRAEVEAVLSKSPKPAPDMVARPLRILLVAGPKDHGKGEHDYPAWQKRWKPMLEKVAGVTVATAFGRPEAAQWERADLVVFYCWGPQFWGEELYKSLDPFLARGGGLVVLHSGVIPAKDNESEALAQRIGLALPPSIKYRHGPLDLKLTAPANHPITTGFPAMLHLVDESYWPCVGDVSKVTVLATRSEAGEDRPMAWTFERGKGRVFCTILGHYSWTLDDPLARLLILRGMAWAAGQPAGRLEALATEGVELKD